MCSALHLARLRVAALLPPKQRALLQHRCAAVEDEDRSHAVEEQLQHAVQHAEDVSVRDHPAIAVPHPLEKLNEPDRDVDRERLPAHRLHRDLPPARLEQCPQAFDAHRLRSPCSRPLLC